MCLKEFLALKTCMLKTVLYSITDEEIFSSVTRGKKAFGKFIQEFFLLKPFSFCSLNSCEERFNFVVCIITVLRHMLNTASTKCEVWRQWSKTAEKRFLIYILQNRLHYCFIFLGF